MADLIIGTTQPDKKSESQEVSEILEKQENPDLIVDPKVPVEWEKYDPVNRSLSTYFGLGFKELDKFQNRIDVIKEWAKSKANSQERVDLLWAIRSLENRLGTPPAGERRINHIYKWVKLENDRLKITQEQRLLENPPGEENE